MQIHLKSAPWFLVYEGDGGAGGAGAGAGVAGGAGAGAGSVIPPKTFTQDEVNTIMAQNKKTLQTQVQTMTQELEQLKTSKSLTEKEREDLQKRIDSLNSDWTTKEQQQQTALEKKTKEFNDNLKKEAEEKQAWRGRYADEATRNQILIASAKHKAVNANQIQSILMPKTQLAEVLDADGKPTGVWAPRTSVEGKDKDGKPVTLTLSVEEAVKHLKDLPDEYGNLFEGGVVPGFGGSGNNRSGGSGSQNPPTDPAAYREWRKKNLM